MELFNGWGGWEGSTALVEQILAVVGVPVIFDKFQQSKSYMFSEEPQIQFIDRVVEFLVAQRRRLPTVLCRRLAKSLRCCSWTSSMTPVVTQRQVLGVDRAENCGGSAVAVL